MISSIKIFSNSHKKPNHISKSALADRKPEPNTNKSESIALPLTNTVVDIYSRQSNILKNYFSGKYIESALHYLQSLPEKAQYVVLEQALPQFQALPDNLQAQLLLNGKFARLIAQIPAHLIFKK